MDKAKKTKLESTYKSKDTEEWLDIKFYRPVGYRFALLFDRFNIHPNIITIISIVFGVLAAICFYDTSITWNASGIGLLILANILDSADGQLARITGKKTLWGRILDGFAGDIWFFSIYFFIGLRLTPQSMPLGIEHNWGIWIWLLMFLSGIISHKDQAGLADYYRNVYMFFHNDKSELTDSEELNSEQSNTPWRKWFWKIWLFFYQRYTLRQESCTPEFQLLRRKFKETYDDKIPSSVSSEFCRRTFHLLKWTNILTFNTRAIVISLSLLIDMPWIYFIFELTVLNVIYFYMKSSHEKACQSIINSIENEQKME